MNPAERTQLLAGLLEGTSITLLELTGPDGVLRLGRASETTTAVAIPVDAAFCEIRAPSVGIFRARHPMQQSPLAQQGAQVAAGDVVALIQIGPLFLHVLAPAAGTISKILAADGDVVGYGTPLFRL